MNGLNVLKIRRHVQIVNATTGITNRIATFKKGRYKIANPQCKNGYIRIATELYEALAKKNVYGRGSANGQIICAVIRKTYGYNKKEDAISISQLIEMTGLCRRTIIYALQDLEAKNVLFIIRRRIQHGNEVNIIKFNKDYDSWVVQNSAPQIISNRQRAAKHSTKLRNLVQNYAPSAKLTPDLVQNYENDVRSFAPTIDNITIDNIQKTVLKDNICAFSDIWKKYPKCIGKKAAERHFKTSVKTQQDCSDIQKALNNYLESETVRKGFIQNGSTWFNNWRDWIDYQETKKKIETTCALCAEPLTGTRYDYEGKKICGKCDLQKTREKLAKEGG